MRGKPTKSLVIISMHFTLTGALQINELITSGSDYRLLPANIFSIITGLGLLLTCRKFFRICAQVIIWIGLLLMPLVAYGFYDQLQLASVIIYMIYIPLFVWEFTVLRDENKMYKSNQSTHSITGSAGSE